MNRQNVRGANEFDDVRPYRDGEVSAVLARLVEDDDVAHSAAAFLAPRLHRWLPGITTSWVKRTLKRRVSGLSTIEALQLEISRFFEHLIKTTTAGMTVSGLENLARDQAHLFISNHRDITLDSGFMNYALWSNGFDTSQIAVGNNLFQQHFATDLMRLNKSFVVRRDVGGPKANLAAMSHTSRYIRHTLEQGESVWIAQREGRAKDGIDRTEPAIIKMFGLAYRKELATIGDWLETVRLVPVSLSYEIDPCAPIKARELYLKAQQGGYEKSDTEDLDSILRGIVGYKGRVSVAFGERVRGDYTDAKAVAAACDREIVGNLMLYPTHYRAFDGSGELPAKVEEAWADGLAACEAEYVDYLRIQYANQLTNQAAVARTTR